jgi:hypothetical protein
MPDGSCPGMPQVTVVDDQFGTHTQSRDQFEGFSSVLFRSLIVSVGELA